MLSWAARINCSTCWSGEISWVAVEDPPDEMFGKLMSISDALMWRYWTLLTDLSPADIEARRIGVGKGHLHPMDVKFELARAITEDFHGADATTAAEQLFRAVHQRRETPEEVEEITIPACADPRPLAKVLVDAGLAPSNAEARRLIQQGGVRLDGLVVRDGFATLGLTSGCVHLLQVGKRRFARLAVS